MPTNIYLPPHGQSRRSFLKRGAWGGALLAVGGVGFLVTRPTKRIPLPKEGLLALDETEYAVVHALAGRMMPPRAGFPSIDQVNVAFNVDRILVRVDPGARSEVKQLLKLFENALTVFVFDRRVKPFTALSDSEQDQVIRDWQESRLLLRRTGIQALRVLVMAAYYASPLTWPAVGYPGPPQGFWQADAPVWKGIGPRPDGNGVFHEEPKEESKGG